MFLRRDVEYSVHKGQISRDDNLRKSDAQVNSYLKLLIKWNPVFLLIAKDQLVCTFNSLVGKICVSCYSTYSSFSLLWKDVHAISDVLRGMVLFVEFKICEKHPWRNVTFSKVARLHYSWKYNIRNVNSGLSIFLAIFRSLVESTGAIKKMKAILLTWWYCMCYNISMHY